MPEQVPVLIAGSGCAGHTAAIYAARADLKPLVLEGNEPGGQLSLTSDVENYPGFPEGIGGFDLVENMKKQAQRFGARYEYGAIQKIDHHNGPPFLVSLDNGKQIECQVIIVATGARARRLGVPGENEFFGKGVSSCATCDGAFFRDLVVGVVGGGDSAMEEALFLTRFASKVMLFHRRDAFRASKIMQDRVFANDRIEVHWNTQVARVVGDDDGVKGVEVVVQAKGAEPETKTLKLDGLFLGIGHIPNTDFLQGVIDLDEEGYALTVLGKHNSESPATKLPGIFACGDVVDKRYRQAITAAGMGCKAALEAEHFLAERSAHVAV